MISRVKIPKLSANIDEVTITGWFKKQGDTVAKGEPLAEITTDKAVFEFESPRSGIVLRILAAEKSVLPESYVIALIGKASDSLPDVSAVNKKLLDQHRRIIGKKTRRSRRTKKILGKSVRATPAARRLAREQGVDLAKLKEKLDVDVITGAMVEKEARAGGRDLRKQTYG